ncbi:HGxxPAAW family protein [Serinibacter salmoneus]|uniref:Uncharacterized protein n=1 Tax=Serinibacter salmoneus TaxID=556530 RepID=A0A2A9D1E0_9MICO|nr:HGxxPAAW family protein [Serinibacter salmoneus]PFG19762.1 hypothetical protein ATL40_1332 [Serinibacter salmoneus]
MSEKSLMLVSEGGDAIPQYVPFHNEGKTTAGWLVCYGLMLAATIVGVGLVAHLTPVWWAGIVVGVLSLVVGGALRAAGLGQPAPHRVDRAGADHIAS